MDPTKKASDAAGSGGMPSPATPSPDQILALREAQRRARKIQRAASYAVFSGCMLGLFSLATLAMGLADSGRDRWIGIASGIGLAGFAFVELKGGERLRRFDASGGRILGFNQLALGAMIVVYSLWQLYASRQQTSGLSQLIGTTGDPQLDALVGDITTKTEYGLYGGMAVVGALVTGLTALYYFSRGRAVRKFKEGTPAWVVEAMRS